MGSGRRRGARQFGYVLASCVLLAAVAACGSTPPPTGSVRTAETTGAATSSATASDAPSPSPSPSATPTPTIAPVPAPTFGSAPSAAGQLDPQTAAALQHALDGVRASAKLPGVAAAVVFPDGRLWTGASGYANLATKQPMTAHTLFSVGSITKTFVAALVLRLAARGDLRLDDPLSRYVPAFPNAAKITLQMLLSHTSGIQDLFQAPGMAEAILADPNRAWTPAEVLARIGKPYFAPGTSYRYSNTNYLLLGLVVERVTGKRLATLIRSEFLTPLGMHETFVQTQEAISGPVAQGYMGPATAPRAISAGQRMLPFVSEVTAAGASGAMASSVTDLATWAAALYGGGVLDDVELASMVDVSPTSPYKPRYPYGLGLEQCTLAGRLAWGHRGHLDGYWASMAYLPNERLTVVVLTNAEWADPLAPSSALVAAAIGPAPASSKSPSPSGSASPAPSGSGPVAPGPGASPTATPAPSASAS